MRRDLHSIVFPVDLTDAEDMELVVHTIQVFVRKKIPVRFGLVPTASSPRSIEQLKVAHYLQETYGLSSLIRYLEQVRYCAGVILFLDTNFLVCFHEEDNVSG